jgi:predicted nucleotidyltransferase
MEFWNEQMTEKSWDVLLKIRKLPFGFVLIGGWANYLWTRAMKSKDIDIVITDFKDFGYLKKGFELRKNDSLRKYEIKIDDIDVDIYVPYFSRLAVPVEHIGKYSATVEGFTVATPPLLLILKQGAELDRKDSVKGEKDRIDIISLLFFADVDLHLYRRLLVEYGLGHYLPRLKSIVASFKEARYLGMTPRQLKLKKKAVLQRLASAAGGAR